MAINTPIDQIMDKETRGAGKSAAAFRTISEVAGEVHVPQHVLRFWETKFSQIKPLKRGGGRRYYRPEDIALLCRIRDLLHSDGYTIRGVQRLFRENGVRNVLHETETAQQIPCSELTTSNQKSAPELSSAVVNATGLTGENRAELKAILDELNLIQSLMAKG
mgnify:CR=1 FL=1